MTNDKKVLILGGTTEAAILAAKINEIPGVNAIASLAGRTQQPIPINNTSRSGGFGGVAGLADYIRQEKINFLIDATHPFAAKISFNAALAADECSISRLMLIRPPWEKIPGDHWIEVESNQGAAHILPGLAKRIFLTIGRQELSIYSNLKDIWFLMRMIDSPEANSLIPTGKLILQRGPFSVDEERAFLQKYKIDAIVSKNSGGDTTYSKIIAARELGLPIVMVQRPSIPKGEKVADVQSVVEWLENKL